MIESILLVAVVAMQGGITLKPGVAAPKPEVEAWYKGDAPTFFEAGKVYVVEFWATWCPPCRTSMPHMTALQKEYPDVVMVGITEEAIAKVEPFINSAEWTEKIGYRIGVDPDRTTNEAYMKAAGRGGIPCAFIIGKDGIVEWIGHPMQMDEPLKQIVAGSFDRNAAMKAAADAEAKTVEDRKVMQGLREDQVKMATALGQGLKTGDWTDYIAKADAMIAKAPKQLADGLRVQKFKILVGSANQPVAGYEFGETLLTTFQNEAERLNDIAWFVVDDQDVKTRNLDFALRAATRADQASEHKEAAIIDTLARVYWEKGDKAKAIELETEAIALPSAGSMKADMEEALKRYKAGA